MIISSTTPWACTPGQWALVVKAVKPYQDSQITITHNGRQADAKRMFAVMGLQVKQGETITVSVQGGDEQKIADQIRGIFEAEQL